MFKSLITYSLIRPVSADTLRAAAVSRPARDPSGLEASFCGFSEVHAEHGVVAEIGTNILMRVTKNARALPAASVLRETRRCAEKIEREQGSKVGRKQLAEIKYSILAEMLPSAPIKPSSCLVWFDNKNLRMHIEAGAHGTADDVIDLLVAATAEIDDVFAITYYGTANSAEIGMTQWILNGEVGGVDGSIVIGNDLKLEAFDENEKSTARYTNCALDSEEIIGRVGSGELATMLALTWNDRISFVLRGDMRVSKIKLLDIVNERIEECEATDFAGTALISCEEIGAMMNDITKSLGGLFAPA